MMRHCLMYHGGFERNFPNLKAGATTFQGTDGTEHPLAWGPEEHGGSNYDRPGREWGTGFVLDAIGCWQLTFATDTTEASVWLEPAT